MASDRVKQLAREHPREFERFAKLRDDELRDDLLAVLESERSAVPA